MNAINWNAIGAISTSIAASVGVFGILVAFRAVKIAEASSQLERRTYMDRLLQNILDANWEVDAAGLPFVPGGEYFVDEAGEILPDVVPPAYLLGSSEYLRLHQALTNAQTCVQMFQLSWAPLREEGEPRSRMEISLDGMEWALWSYYHASLERPTFWGTNNEVVNYLFDLNSVDDDEVMRGILFFAAEAEKDRDVGEEDRTTSISTAREISQFFERMIIKDFKRVVDEDAKLREYDRKTRNATIRQNYRPVIGKTDLRRRPWQMAKRKKV